MEPAGWSRPSSIGMWRPAGSARPRQSPSPCPCGECRCTFLAVVPRPNQLRTGPTGSEGSRQHAVDRGFCSAPVRECVSGLLQAAQAHKGSDKVRWQSDGNHLRMLTGTRCPTPSLPRGAICVPRSRARPFAALSICCGKPQLCAANGNGDRVGRLGWVGAAAGRFLRRSHDWCFARRAAAPIWPAQSAPRCVRGRRLATVPGSCMAAEGRPGWLRVCTDCFGQHVDTGMSAIEAGTETPTLGCECRGSGVPHRWRQVLMALARRSASSMNGVKVMP